jgi:hypothetical protein
MPRLSFFHSSLLIFLLVAASACAQQYDPGSDFRTELTDNGTSVWITEYLGNKQEVRIPQRIGRLPVTGIGYEVFRDKDMTSITIPNSVTHIGEWSFADNRLISVTIPGTVTNIEEWAFAYNSRLSNVTIGANVSLKITVVED